MNRQPATRFVTLSLAAAAACATTLLGSCDGSARAPEGASPATNLAVGMPPLTDRPGEGEGTVEHVVDDVVSSQEAGCGVGDSDQAGQSGQKVTLLSPKRPDAEAVASCLLRNRSYSLVDQYAGSLLILGRNEEALAWNRRLAEKALGDQGASLETGAEALSRLKLAPHLAGIARRFLIISEKDGRLVSRSEAAKWESLLRSQERQELEAAGLTRSSR